MGHTTSGWLLIALGLFATVYGFVTGDIAIHGLPITRNNEPFLFWVAIFLAVALAAFGIFFVRN